MNAQNFVRFLVRQHFYHSAGMSACQGSAVGGEGKRAGLVLNPGFLEFLFCFSDPGDFRLRVDNPWHGVEVNVGRFTGDQLGYGNTFLGCLVRQHRAAHAVTDGPDTRSGSFGLFIDLDLTPIVELYTRPLVQQALGIGLAANADQKAIEGQPALTILVFQRDAYLVFDDLRALDQGAEPDVQALLFEFPRSLFAHIPVSHRQKIG